jgi:hypothetical protein
VYAPPPQRTGVKPFQDSLGRVVAADGKPSQHQRHGANEATRQVVENPVTRVLREGTVVGVANHTVLLGRDGEERPIDDSGAPIHDAQGQLVGIVLVFRDITVRRQAEASRRRRTAGGGGMMPRPQLVPVMGHSRTPRHARKRAVRAPATL